MRTTLESGAWIEHVPLQDLKFGHKRALDRAAKISIGRDAVDGDGNVDVGAIVAGMDVYEFTGGKRDALWALLITGWSYDFPVPELDKVSGAVTGAEGFDGIPLDDAAEIEILFEPYAAKLDRKPDPKAATTSSSNGSSRASAAHGSRKD